MMVVQPSAAEKATMRTKNTSSRPTGPAALSPAALALAAALLTGCTFEQILIGQVYIIDTPVAGACPELQWRFAVNPQRAIIGSISSKYGVRKFADLSGVLNADDSFQMTATEVAAGGTTSVTGQFTTQISTISIHGDAAGSACNGQIFQLRLGWYFSRSGGGGGGGGGGM
jgi:hypothetical protein